MGALDPTFLRRCDRLRVRVQTARGSRPGETPIPRTTQAWGIEFETYKEYSPGDDFRYVDWNAVGRLDQLVVRTFTAEREIPYHIFLDTSASMGAPTTDQKFTFASDLASALGYIILNNNDPLRLIALTAPEKHQLPFRSAPLLRHRSQFSRLPSFMDTLVPSGKTYLREAVRTYTEQTYETGVAILISDFLVEPPIYEDTLALLRGRGYEVKVIHVLGATELAPEHLFRRGKLHDVENHTERWITLSKAHLKQYQDALHTHMAALQSFCHRHHILYTQVATDANLATVLTEEFPRTGLLIFR
ncbi:MAG: DUF58 domain-containing protein [Candidatus Binatia bacterium]